MMYDDNDDEKVQIDADHIIWQRLFLEQLNTLAQHGILALDLKPNNIVVKYSDKSKRIVDRLRIIDCGGNFMSMVEMDDGGLMAHIGRHLGGHETKEAKRMAFVMMVIMFQQSLTFSKIEFQSPIRLPFVRLVQGYYNNVNRHVLDVWNYFNNDDYVCRLTHSYSQQTPDQVLKGIIHAIK